MSVVSTIELLCYFESLRNVDLFEQGFYCVRSKIYTEKNNVAGVPLTHYNTSSPTRKIDNPRHRLFSAQISPQSNTYSTKTFWVQYTEEVIDLNEAVHFRIEVPDLESTNIILEVELLFSPDDSTKSIEQLKPVSQQKFRMKAMQQGLNQFYPIIFDEWHFAVVRFAVHTCLIDFNYKSSLASLFRFSSFSTPNYANEIDRMDASLFGVPCRKWLQDSYAKLSRNFQKLCVHVPAKQRETLGNDYFVAPPLSVSLPVISPLASSKSVSAPSSPVISKSGSVSSSSSSSFPSPSSSSSSSSSTEPYNPTPISTANKQRSMSLITQPTKSNILQQTNIQTSIDFKNRTPILETIIDDETDDDASDNDDETSNNTESTTLMSPTTSSTPPPPFTKDDNNNNNNNSNNNNNKPPHPLKLALLLSNVRDQNGIGSPRVSCVPPPSGIPPPSGAPPPFNISDHKAANALIAGNPKTSPPSSGPSTPRFSASTGNRPSPRDCTSALSFFSRPATPMASPTPSPSSSLPPSPSVSSAAAAAAAAAVAAAATASSISSSSPALASSTSSASSSDAPAPSSNPPPTFALLSLTSPSSASLNSPSPSPTIPARAQEIPPDALLLNPLRSKSNSLPSGPVVAEELRKSRPNRRRSVTFTPRPLLGPAPQELRTKEIMSQLHYIGDQIFALWIRFTKVFHLVGKENTFRIAQKYEQKYLRLFQDSVFREVAHVSSLGQMLELQANPQRHRQMVQSVRNSEYYKKLKSSRFELVILRPELAGQPIILEQVIETAQYAVPEKIIHLSEEGPSSTPPPNGRKLGKQLSFVNTPPKAFAGSHLYIMVHGLAGNPWDLRMFRNQIALNFPESEFLICSCVEQNTLGDIEEMGNNVAKEIVEYIHSSSLQIGKISFVGHSLGGVIIRAALCDPLLGPYLDKLYTFVSLSVPHIGTLFPYSSLIPGAMWVWQKWSNSACLLQLRLIDHSDPTRTYLYKLSQKKGLEYFQNILLVSSEQDLYVPFHSARIELCKEAEGKREGKREEKSERERTNNGQPFATPLVEMVQNVWDNVLEGWRKRGRFGEIVRYDVVFESHRGMDGMIGRSAHIRLLDSPKVMQMLITTNANLFK